MSTIYQIIGHTGEYSDSFSWVAKSFFDKAQAEAYLEKLNEIAKKSWRSNFNKEGYEDFSEMRKVQEAVEEELQNLDPKCSVDYTGVSYSLSEEDVL